MGVIGRASSADDAIACPMQSLSPIWHVDGKDHL